MALFVWVLATLLVSGWADTGFVMGGLTAAESVNRIRVQEFNSSSADVFFDSYDANVTGQWMDFESQVLFVATRNAQGGGNIFRVQVPNGATGTVYWYGGSVAGTIYGLSGSRVLNSPSIYWVWDPMAASSPPYTNNPTLYRMPLLGGYPEVVTLHAERCEQMSIVGLGLFCLANNTMYRFDMAKPNSAFLPIFSPPNVQWKGFIASREHVLFMLSEGNVLYRVEGSNFTQVSYPTYFDSDGWGPNWYSPPTDRLLLRSNVQGELVVWIGMESFWEGIVGTANSTGMIVGQSALRVSSFSGGVIHVVRWVPLVMALVLMLMYQ